MTAVDTQGPTPEFVNRFKAYREVTRRVDKVSREENYSIDEINIDESLKQELPEEYSKFIEFINQNLISLIEEDEEALTELKEKSVVLLQKIREDIDREIWGLIDEGIEPESIEYLHSLFTDAITNLIQLLKENTLQELDETQKMQPSLNALMTGFQKFFIILENGKMSDKEKRNANNLIIKLESEMENEENFQKIEKEII